MVTKGFLKDGREVEVVAVKRGWVSVKLHGVVFSVRSSEIDMANVQELAGAVPATKEAVDPVAVDPVAVASDETPDVAAEGEKVSRAAPAHVVGDVKPEAKGKIGETVFDMTKYFVSDVKTASGRRTIDTNDEVAQALRGLPIDEVYTMVAEARGVTVESLKAKYQHLNVGMQRMNLGNQMRGAAKAKEAAEAKAAAAIKRQEESAKREAAKAEQESAKAAAKAEREAKAAAAKAEREAKAAAAKVEQSAA